MSSKFVVTLQSLRKSGACYEGYNRVVRSLQGKSFSNDDLERTSYIQFNHKEPINLLSILESNGIDDALWSLRCVEGVDRDARLYAVWCARQVEHLMADPCSKNALNVAERHANGLATDDELTAACDAAWAAARAAEWTAARAAAWAAEWTAARAAEKAAAWAAEWTAARDAQKKMLIKMCNNQAPWQV